MTVRSTGTSERTAAPVGVPHPRGVEAAKMLDLRVQTLSKSIERVLRFMARLKFYGKMACTDNGPPRELAKHVGRILVLSSQCEALIATLSERIVATSGQIMGGAAEGRELPASWLPLRVRNPQHLPSGDPMVHKASVAARAQLAELQAQLKEASNCVRALGVGASFLRGRLAMTPFSIVPPSSIAIAQYLLENGELPGGGTVIGRGGFGEVRVVPMGGNGSFVAKSAFRAPKSGGGGGALALGGPPGLANEAVIHARAAAACPDVVIPIAGIYNGQIILPKAQGTLGPQIRNGVLDMSYVLWMVEGVAELHAAGIVHRDLKAQNYLILDGLPCLIDFGYARHVHEGETVKEDTPIGTHTTMAPEVMKNLRYDPKAADVFSFGVLLYQIASHGRLPWEDDQGNPLVMPQQFFALALQSPPRPPNLDHIADGPFKDLIRRMLSYVPAERPTMAAVAEDPALQMPLPMIVGDAGAGPAQVEPASGEGEDA